MPSRGNKALSGVLVVAVLGIGVLVGIVVSQRVRATRYLSGSSDSKLPPPSPAELSSSFAQIAVRLEPAVVNINTESTVRVTRRTPGAGDVPFGEFFDKFFDSPDAPVGSLRQQSLGSGVVLDKSGLILTNYHVVTRNGEDKPVDRINVFLHGDENTKYEAKIVGTDKWTDLAVIKIDAGRPLAAAQLGDSDSMRVGDWVLAIGSPFGLESTVTAGIVSAKGRDIEGGSQGQFKRFIQTDAAINPGNSGGPLANLAGQVIGINTAIATQRGTYDGVGFAIPSNTARKVYNALVTTGNVRRGAIGVQFSSQNNAALLRSFGTDHGIVINGVEAGSPAERAGLKMGDVILEVGGKAISNADEMVSIVAETEIGKKLHVEFLRKGKRLAADIEVGDRTKVIAEAGGNLGGEGGATAGAGTRGVLGVTVKSLTREQVQELAERLHLESAQGVLVTDVLADGFSADVGVEPGDVILSINHNSLASAEDFRRVQSSLKSGGDVLFLVARRSGQRSYTTLFLADRLP